MERKADDIQHSLTGEVVIKGQFRKSLLPQETGGGGDHQDMRMHSETFDGFDI